jgi:hypothetical protein
MVSIEEMLYVRAGRQAAESVNEDGDRNRLEGRTRMQRVEKVKRTVRRNVGQLYLRRAGNVKELKNCAM